MKKNKKLYICSCGLKAEHITLETIRALKAAEVVFSHSLAGGHAEALVRGFCRDFRSLVNSTPREITRAVGEAFKTSRTAAFLTYGNPFFLNTAAGLLKAGLTRKGVTVEVLAAVSSFDAMVNMLGLNEFAAAGVRLIHAGLAGGSIEFSPGMDTLVFMMDNLNRVEKPEHAGARAKFIKSLAAAYPPGHKVLLVNAPFMEDGRGRVLRTSVRNLARVFARADKNTTLFIPELKKRAAAVYKRV